MWLALLSRPDAALVAINRLRRTDDPTGYTQTLERRVGGELRRTYTLGHDVLAQAETVAQGALLPGEPVIFLHDGHGSTRALVRAVTAAVVQRFAHDAYGNHLLADGSGLTSAADAITDLLYSGEATDPTGRQYLRARWYDPTTGRFNRLDPFAGDTNDPQSLHKYLYAHADPIMGTDPSGESPLLDLAFSASASMYMRGASMTATGGFATALVGRLSMAIGQRGMLLTSYMNSLYNSAYTSSVNALYRLTSFRGPFDAHARGGLTPTERFTTSLASRIKFTDTAGRHMSEAARYVPRHTLAEAILLGTRMPDPQGAAGAVKIVHQIFKNGRARVLEIVYRESDKTILHFLYR